LIDREYFYGVPKTQLVKIVHPFNKNSTQTKVGSLQEFVNNDGCSEEFGPTVFPVKEVHKIGILDLQMFNVDRHSGNILVKKSNNKTTLVPIDQGFSLPDNLECLWFEWMNWSQSTMSFDDETKAYITRIDIDRDMSILSRELHIRPECLRTMKISTTLLKKCALNNFSLFEIGSIVCRKSTDELSELELMCKKAKQVVREMKEQYTGKTSPSEEDLFFIALFDIMDKEIAKRSRSNVHNVLRNTNH